MRLTLRFLCLQFILLLGLCIHSTLYAAVNFSIEPAQAQPNDSITLRAIYINTKDEATQWEPPTQLELYWHTGPNTGLTTQATITQIEPPRLVPVNGFAIAEWHSTVPADASGIQTIAIEGIPQLIALDIVPGPSQLASSPPSEAVAPQDAPTVTATSVAATEPTAFEQVRNALSVYESMYFLYGTRPEQHARFQLSFKYRLLSPSSLANSRFYHHFYLGYTQRALWDLSQDSIPFVDSTYNPSFFWYKEKLWESASQPFYLGLNAGVEHESNGKSGASSRSLNDFYLQPELNYTFDNGSNLRFMPRIKHYVGVSSDNPDYKDYMGFVNWRLRWQQANGLSIMGSYQQGKQGRRTHQLDVAWPLKRTPLNLNGYLYAQYFNGYGETLLHYSQRAQSQVRFGIALTP